MRISEQGRTMIQFTQAEVCQLIRACETYKAKTGSEYIWDQYDDLQSKLRSYGEEVTEEEHLVCNN